MAQACSGQGELVFKYVEGALPAEEAASFRKHLEECEACKRLQADFQRVAERARLLPHSELALSDDRHLRAKSGRLAWSFARALPFVAVIAVAALGFGIWSVWSAKAEATPPAIVSLAPADGAEGLRPGDGLHIIFSEEMNKESVLAALRTEPSLALAASWEGKTLRLTLPPNVQWATTYRLTLGTGATNAAGVPLAAGASLRFTTAPPPDTIVSDEEVPWSAEEVMNVQMQVDAGTYDYRATPLLAAERDLNWLMLPEERAEYGAAVLKEEFLHRTIVMLPRVDGTGRLELTLEQLGGKRETDPWFATRMVMYASGGSAPLAEEPEDAAAGTDGAGTEADTDNGS